MKCVEPRRQLRVSAVHRQSVLREVVGPHGQEIGFASDAVRHDGGRRCFDHCADFDGVGAALFAP